jgi:hypothetical protein
VTGGWRKLHNEEPHNLYSSQKIIKMIKSRRMKWACSMHGAYEKCVKNFGWKAEGERSLR